MSNEILTIQLGHYANFVGAHWWNMLFEDLTSKRAVTGRHSDVEYETEPELFFHNPQSDSSTKTSFFVPRLVALDVQGCVGAVTERGVGSSIKDFNSYNNNDNNSNNKFHSSGLDEQAKQVASWHGQVHVAGVGVATASSSSVKNNNSNNTSMWSDFLAPRLHAKSLLLLPPSASAAASDSAGEDTDLQHFDSDQSSSSSSTSSAIDLRVVREELDERIRFFSEACDNLQGFHLMTTAHDGCAQLAADLLTVLADDFGRKCTFLIPVSQPHLSRKDDATLAVQRTISWAKFLPIGWANSSSVVPLSLSRNNMWQGDVDSNSNNDVVTFPDISYFNPNLHYHTSALLAAALDTATLPYRIARSATSFYSHSSRLGMAEYFNICSKYLKLNEMKLVLPYRIDESTTRSANQIWVSVSPPHLTADQHVAATTTKTNNNKRLLSRCAVLRGSEMMMAAAAAGGDHDNSSRLLVERAVANDFESVLADRLSVVDSFVKTHSCVTSKAMTIGQHAFPQDINIVINNNSSNKKQHQLTSSSSSIRKVPVAAALVSSGRHVEHVLSNLHDDCKRISRSRYSNLMPEMTDWSENLEWLVDKAQHAQSLM